MGCKIVEVPNVAVGVVLISHKYPSNAGWEFTQTIRKSNIAMVKSGDFRSLIFWIINVRNFSLFVSNRIESPGVI